jgi:hypothetical protein
MNLELLIHCVAREMAELVANLATAGGARASLSRTEDHLFKQLVDQLDRRGVSRKVCADMFGLTPRSYLRKIRRLAEGSTEGGGSLWEEVLQFIASHQPVERAHVVAAFHRQDSELLAGVLHDLVDSGIVARAGQAPSQTYSVVEREKLSALTEGDRGHALEAVVWAMVYRLGPVARSALVAALPGEGISEALDRLEARGRVVREGELGPYSAREFSVPRGAAKGWEAAVFDHVHAMVKTISARLAGSSEQPPLTGGSTYSFEVWPGHPFEAEVLGQLEGFRERMSALRQRVREYNQDHPLPDRTVHVTVYGGQCVSKDPAS